MIPEVEKEIRRWVKERQAASAGYNPPRDPEVLARDAAEVARESRPRSSASATGRGGAREESVRAWEDKDRVGGGSGVLVGPRRGDAKDEEGEEDLGGAAAGIRAEGGQGRILRADQQGQGDRDRDTDGGEVQEEASAGGDGAYQVYTITKPTKAAVEDAIAALGKRLVSATKAEREVRWRVTVTVKR